MPRQATRQTNRDGEVRYEVVILNEFRVFLNEFTSRLNLVAH